MVIQEQSPSKSVFCTTLLQWDQTPAT